ncbi:MAG: putative heme transporter [Acidimicrobiaceae bacterium]
MQVLRDQSGRSFRPLTRVLAVVAGVAAMVALAPTMVEVYGEIGEAAELPAVWLVAIVGFVFVGFVSGWALTRIALRADGWFDVAAAHLAGNAASQVLPAGGPVGAVVQLRMLRRAGFDLTAATTCIGVLSVLHGAGLLALAAVVLPVGLMSGHLDPQLAFLVWVGAAVVAAALMAGIALLIWDRPVLILARAVQRVLLRVPRCRAAAAELPARVLTERSAMRTALGDHRGTVVLAMVGKALGDYLALYAALLAAGASPNPVVPLAALAAANITGMIPITPGGLGFVEAGLTATLAVAGVPAEQALVAAVAYRAASTWLPVGGGLVAYVAFQLRHSRIAKSLADDSALPELAPALS